MTARYFFSHIRDIPARSGIAAWGAVHLLWLAVMAAAWVWLAVRYRRLGSEARRRWLLVLATVIWLQEAVKDILHGLIGSIEFEHLPLHLCGLSMFVCLLYALTRRPFWGQLLYSIVLPGAVAALLFPDWTEFPALHFASIHSFSIHGNLVLFAILPLVGGQVRPDWRALPKIFGLVVGVCAVIYPINMWLGTNFFFIATPSPGSPLVPLARLMGNPGYILGMAALVVALWVVMYLPWVLADRRREKTRLFAYLHHDE